MSFRELVEADCGGANPLMRLGNQVARDPTFRDEGLGRQQPQNFLPHEAPPQTFRMDDLLKEMRQMDIQQAPPPQAHPMFQQHPPPPQQQYQGFVNAADKLFGDQQHDNWLSTNYPRHVPSPMMHSPMHFMPRFAPPPPVPWLEAQRIQANQVAAPTRIAADLFKGELKTEEPVSKNFESAWSQLFDDYLAEDMGNYHHQFWENLQTEWRRISKESDAEGHPWLSDFSEIYDPYKEYKFDETNPLIEVENALEKGKAFLAQNDTPSAVLCFEAAVRQEPQNTEAWQLLGITQAENENDPNAIAALRKALELNPSNMEVLMALAVSYTNESLQNQALKMLTNWLSTHPKYAHLVPPQSEQQRPEEGAAANMLPPSSVIRGVPSLKDVQGYYERAREENRDIIDPNIQEALGVLYNLSQEYDKAADCYRGALLARPDDAKTLNRLGASLANGDRHLEAMDAYKKALEIQPGFIRATYNLGIICTNLKQYNEAAGHLLTALNHQATSTTRSGINSANTMSDSIWSTLRMVLSLGGRHDLHPALDHKDLQALNSAFSANEG